MNENIDMVFLILYKQKKILKFIKKITVTPGRVINIDLSDSKEEAFDNIAQVFEIKWCKDHNGNDLKNYDALIDWLRDLGWLSWIYYGVTLNLFASCSEHWVRVFEEIFQDHIGPYWQQKGVNFTVNLNIQKKKNRRKKKFR